MSRLAPPAVDRMSAAQRVVHDAIASGPRAGVRGPLAIWLHRPELAARAQELGRYCRYDSSLPSRLSELAILVIAALWRSDYEWFAHEPLARAAGIQEDVLDALRHHRPPPPMPVDEQLVHDFLVALHAGRRVETPLYERATALLGEGGVVDLVGIAGYYTLIAMTINVFEVGLPGGAEAVFAR